MSGGELFQHFAYRRPSDRRDRFGRSMRKHAIGGSVGKSMKASELRVFRRLQGCPACESSHRLKFTSNSAWSVWDFQIQIPSWGCTSRSIFWDGLSRLGRTSRQSRIRKENSLWRMLDLPLWGWRFITLSTSSIRSEVMPKAG